MPLALGAAIIEPVFDARGNPIHRLAAGVYSVFVVPGDDCGGGGPGCPSAQAAYQLTLTQM